MVESSQPARARAFVAVVALAAVGLLAPLAPTTAPTSDGADDWSAVISQHSQRATVLSAHDPSSRLADTVDTVVASVALSQAAFGAGEAERVLIGRHDIYADSLAGAPLAGTSAPLLLTTGGPDARLRGEVRAEIERVIDRSGGCPTAYLLGGERAISPAVAGELVDLGLCPVRLGGPGRQETAEIVAREVIAVHGPTSHMLLARADDWADAATGGAWAAATSTPILITQPSDLHPAVTSFVRDHPQARITLLGGERALSPLVESQAWALTGDVRRVAGPARDHTAVAIADRLWGAGSRNAVLVPGWADTGWAYALAAAPYSAIHSAPQLMVAPADLSPAAADWLAGNRPSSVMAIGPPALISDGVLDAAQAAAGASAGTPTTQAPEAPPEPPKPPATHYDFYVIEDQIVRWDPCRPIQWRFNTSRAPASGLADATEAFNRIVSASGLPISYGGTTTVRPSESTAQDFPGPTIVVGFGDATDYPLFEHPSVVGVASAQLTYTNGGSIAINHATVIINLESNSPPGFGEYGTGVVLMHEGGHAVGLGHPEDSNQIMSPIANAAITDFQDGDLWGLWRIGSSQGCLR